LPQNPSPVVTRTSTGQSPSRDSRWLSVVKTLLLIVALVYVAVKTGDAVTAVRNNTLAFHVSVPWLIASGTFVLTAYALLIWTWAYVLTALSGKTLPYGIAARIWFISNLGKYIPGKVWQIVQMGIMSTEQGIDAVSSASAAIVNAAVNVACGLAIAVIAGAPTFDRILAPSGYAWLSRTVAVAAVVCVGLLPFLLPHAFRVAHRRFGVAAPLEKPPMRAIIVSVAANFVAWILYGAAFKCLILGILGSAPGSPIEYTAVFAMSYVIGYLAIFAPGGIGIREVVLIQVLVAAGLASAPQATAISVASRLWLVVIEIVPALLFLAYRRRPRNETTSAAD
jgi:glycosyltransferase 2 family protein